MVQIQKNFLVVSAVLIGWFTIIDIAQADGNKCKIILDDARRLKCFDELFPLDAEIQSNNSTETLSVIDYITDYKILRKKPVSVAGYGIAMGDMTLLYEKLGDMSAVFINTDKLNRDDRRALLENCSSGCAVVVTGVASTMLDNPAINANSIALD